MDKKDIEILTFIYDRMINVYGENESYDYMTAFSKIIDKQQLTIPDVVVTKGTLCDVCGSENTIGAPHMGSNCLDCNPL